MQKIKSRTNQIYQIEFDMFDIIAALHTNLSLKKKDSYKLCLVAMDTLNEDYKKLTGEYRLHPLECLKYYENLWKGF